MALKSRNARSRLLGQAIANMFETPPNGWWRFVPCGLCNAHRGEACQQTFGPALRPHASRVRSAQALHGTLWLLDNGYATDVLGGEL